MKFIVDAQLPRRLVIHLRRLGFDAQHTWVWSQVTERLITGWHKLQIMKVRLLLPKTQTF